MEGRRARAVITAVEANGRAHHTGEAPAVPAGRMTMAQLDFWADGSQFVAQMDLEFFYNVSFAVGPGRTPPNRRDDVLLVQYFLKTIAGTVVVGPGWEVWTPPKTARPFLVDGVMGPVTAAWIKSYQNGQRWLFKDGVVDRALGVYSSISHTPYTILSLNHHFRNVEWEKFKALEDDRDAPDELRAAIRRSRGRGAPGLPQESPGRPK